MASPKPALARPMRWLPSEAPPPRYRPYAHKLDAGGLALYSAADRLLEADEGRMYARAVTTTPDRDRVGDEVVPEGCDLSNYRLNPVWFFGHQTIPFPVGLAEAPDGSLDVLIVPGSHVEAGCYFHQSTKEACEVFDLVARRILRGVSIAFNPTVEPAPVKKQAGQLYAGLRYAGWELIENSWVGVPCNPFSGQVREYLSRDRASGGGRVTPLVRKALAPLAEPKRAWLAWDAPVRKYITHDGDEWVVHAEDGKVLGRHDSEEDAKRQLAAIEAHKHGKGKNMARKEGMSSSSGTRGGYGLPGTPGEAPAEVEHHKLPPEVADEVPAEHHDTVKAIRHVMRTHHKEAEAEAPGAPHDAYFHAGKGHVHHHHHKEASAEHLERVKGDMELIDGVHGLTQHTEPPDPAEGHVKVYGLPGHDGVDEAETHHPAPAEDVADGVKALKWLFGLVNKGVGLSTARQLCGPAIKRFVKAKKASKTVEECVHHKIPKLIAEGMPQDQAEAVAFSMCGEKKAKKDFDPAAEEDEAEPEKPEHDLAALIGDLAQIVVCIQEHATAQQLAAAKPEEEEEEEDENYFDDLDSDRGGREATEAALSRYRRSGRVAVRKMHPKHKEDLMGALHAAADHLHKMGTMELSNFGRRHKEESLMHARTLDRHHGMLSAMRDETPREPADVPPHTEDPAEGGGADWLDQKSAAAIMAKLDKIDARVGRAEAPIRAVNPSLLRNGGD